MGQFDSEEYKAAIQQFIENAQVEAEQTGADVRIITPEMLLKRLVWDIVPCEMAAKTAKHLGLQPASDEVEDMEHKESHLRMRAPLEVLGPLISQLSLFSAQTIQAAMIVEHGDEIREAEFLDPSKFGQILFQVLIAALAELIDVEVIHLPHHRTGFTGE